MSVHLRSLKDLCDLIPSPPPGLASFLKAHLPGPLTVLLPSNMVSLPSGWELPWEKIGLRLPAHPAYLKAAPFWSSPLLMTSANPHGSEPLEGDSLEQWVATQKKIGMLRPSEDLPSSPASGILDLMPSPHWIRNPASKPVPTVGKSVLIVCSGNTCRSPLAALLLKQALADAWGISTEALSQLGWVVESAGTFAMSGAPGSPGSSSVAEEMNLTLKDHRAEALRTRLAERKWDILLGMGSGHLGWAPPDLNQELLSLEGKEIRDPFGEDLEVYRQTTQELQEAIEARVRAWSSWDRSD